MGRKCRVKDCLSDSRRPEDLGVTFHKIPFHADIRPKWLSLCKIPAENQSSKIIYVCSRHFRRNDFCTFKGTKYMLKQGVLPSMFPWTNETNKTKQTEIIKPKEEIKEEILDENEQSTPLVVDKSSKNDSSTSEKKITESGIKNDKQQISKKIVDDSKRKSTESQEIKRKSTESSVDGRKKSFDSTNIKKEPIESVSSEPIKIKEEPVTEDGELSDSKDSSSQDEYIALTDFTQGLRVEVTDFSGPWYPAKILEVDYTENEVFIEFEDSSKSNEWIPMDSKRLRQCMNTERIVHFDIGERVMATWKNSIKFPATVQKKLENDMYEVLFDDNISLVLKAAKISKASQSIKKMIQSTTPKVVHHPSPLFGPAEGSKQDRRDRKRKLNVAELFNKKRSRTDSSTPDKHSLKDVNDIKVESGSGNEAGGDDTAPPVNLENVKDEKDAKNVLSTSTAASISILDKSANSPWICRWLNGEPVGKPSVVDTRRSVIVDDPHIPPGWIKHFVCRAQGSSAGKWDTVVISPEGKKFRSRSDVQAYLEKENLPYNIEQFDFSLHLKKARSLGLYEINENIKKSIPKTPVLISTAAKGKVSSIKTDNKDTTATPTIGDKDENTTQSETPNSLKIIFEDGAYKCPIEGCAKTFRKENLTQMHVKHYHPEYSKLIGSTPNVADLAYARTVGEPIEDFLPKVRFTPAALLPSTTNTTTATEKKTDTTHKTSTNTSTTSSSARNSASVTKTVVTPVSETDVYKKVDNEKNTEPDNTSTPLSSKRHKDSEIVKMLSNDHKNTKPDVFKIESKLVKIATNINTTLKKDSPKHTPDIKESVDIKEPKLNEHKSSGGIKTLLPVIRTQESDRKVSVPDPTPYHQDEKPHKSKNKHFKRRRNNSELDHRRRRYTKHDYDYYDYHDTGSRSPDYVPSSYGRKRKNTEYSDIASPAEFTYQQQQQQHPKHIVTETGEVIKIVTMKQEEIINCTCGYMEEDGLMIQCELCLCWQHAYCNNIEREDQVPEKYICYICQNPLRMRASRKYIHDQDWLKQGTLATANFHAKDDNLLAIRFERLRRSHELSGNLRELSSVIHSLRVKLKIAENKDHPKFYLWSKPWPKTEIDNNITAVLENDNFEKENLNSTIKQELPAIPPIQDIESSLHKLLNTSEENDGNKSSLNFGLVTNANDNAPTTSTDLLNILEGTETKSNEQQQQEQQEEEAIASTSTTVFMSPKKEIIENKNWIDDDGGVISGEVSDGEIISQALASEALAGDLLSSPTSLNLAALTPSDIEKIQNTIDNSGALVNPCIPEPEAKIEPDVCRDNLIENISQYQKLINSRMDSIENEIKKLENEDTNNTVINSNIKSEIKLKEALTMMIRDLGKMRKLATLF